MGQRGLLATSIATLAALVIVSSASATPIANSFGLANPGTTITFDEIVFAQGTLITTQYSALGVEFSPGLRFDSQGVSNCCNGITGHYVGNNGGPFLDPFSVIFTFGSSQTQAAFALATNPTTSTFTALLNGNVVETFSSPTHFNASGPYYFGFTGIAFNEIRVDISPSLDQGLIDNIQFGSSVPLPPALLLVLGAVVVAAARRHGAGREQISSVDSA